MPTPEEVDAVAQYGPIDLRSSAHGSAYIARWASDTYRGERMPPGRWYHLLASDLVTTLGFIECSTGEFYAYRDFEVGQTLGGAFNTMNEAIVYLGSDA